MVYVRLPRVRIHVGAATVVHCLAAATVGDRAFAVQAELSVARMRP